MAEATENKQNKEKSLESEILIKVSQIASSTLELKDILDTITHTVANTLNKDRCSVCFLKPEGKIVCIESPKGAGSDSVKVFCLKDEDESVNNIFKDLQPVAVEDIRKEPRLKAIVNPESTDLLSLLAAPIIRDNSVIGILMVQTIEPYKYTQEEIYLFTIISHNICSAIKNAELYKSVKTQLDELKVIHEIGKAITSILNIDELLPYICREVSKVYNVRGCILRLLEGEKLLIKASYGLPELMKHEMDLCLGEGISGNVAMTGKPLLIDDTKKMPENLRVPGVDSTSVICVPLTIGDQVTGTLGLYDKKDEWGVTYFTQDDLNSLMTFASVSSIAIENARLYRAELDTDKDVTQTNDNL